MHAQFILYVKDQAASCEFYRALLGIAPSLNVPGMTEFELSEGCKLGLMPEDGIARILTPRLPHPADASGVPRCELYLLVKDAQQYCRRAEQHGATLVSTLSARDWGHRVAYFADADGHVVAIAEPS